MFWHQNNGLVSINTFEFVAKQQFLWIVGVAVKILFYV